MAPQADDLTAERAAKFCLCLMLCGLASCDTADNTMERALQVQTYQADGSVECYMRQGNVEVWWKASDNNICVVPEVTVSK